MAGDDARPAVPGYDPDIAAELYTVNGDTDTHLQEAYGTLAFTPEMSTCEVASAVDPGDEWEPEDCGSGFEFPDDEDLIQAEFEKNIPFALAVAQSAADPDDPVSVVDIDTPDFVIDPFAVSYGDPQQVAVTAKRDLRGLRMEYRIDGGRTRTTSAREWRGGERYGGENDDYYAEYRGVVRGAGEGRPGGGLVLRRLAGSGQPARRQPAGRERALHLHGRRGHRRPRSSSSPTRTTPASTRPIRPASPRPSTSTNTSPRWPPTASTPTSGTSTPRACPTTSGCSTTTPPSSGTSATTV